MFLKLSNAPHDLVLKFGPQELNTLSPLTGLTVLQVPLAACPEDCQQQFLASMPLLQHFDGRGHGQGVELLFRRRGV